MTLIVTLDDSLVVAAPSNPREAPDVYQALVGGLHTAPTVIAHPTQLGRLQVLTNPACLTSREADTLERP